MTKGGAMIAACVLLTMTPRYGAVGQTFSPTVVFEATTTTPDRSGASAPVHVNIQAWGIGRRSDDSMQEMPRGFYIAHLLSGAVSTTANGVTAQKTPGDYWTVKAGETMQIKVIGQFAVLETIAVTTQ
jgi:hypothetical protein